tara:strand:- start:821 stop:1240 length:420 start_codon:yes stop_codon:yes gene_type:complete
MGYSTALEAAGAKVLDFKEFGSYQGTWIAKVVFQGSETWVMGSFGSCEVCDTFQADFGYSEGRCEEHRHDFKPGKDCSKCEDALGIYNKKLKDFGLGFFTDGGLTQEDIEKEVGRNAEWSYEDKEASEYVKANPLKLIN